MRINDPASPINIIFSIHGRNTTSSRIILNPAQAVKLIDREQIGVSDIPNSGYCKANGLNLLYGSRELVSINFDPTPNSVLIPYIYDVDTELGLYDLIELVNNTNIAFAGISQPFDASYPLNTIYKLNLLTDKNLVVKYNFGQSPKSIGYKYGTAFMVVSPNKSSGNKRKVFDYSKIPADYSIAQNSDFTMSKPSGLLEIRMMSTDDERDVFVTVTDVRRVYKYTWSSKAVNFFQTITEFGDSLVIKAEYIPHSSFTFAASDKALIAIVNFDL